MTTAAPVNVRRDDGELVGVLVPTEELEWIPCTVFGSPIGDPQSRDSAERRLHSHGLRCLAEKWLYLENGDWITAHIVEASPARVTIRFVDYEHPELFGETRVLDVPVAESLRIM